MYGVFDNPLWWVIPALLIGSFLVNHKIDIPGMGSGKKDKDNSAEGGSSEKPSAKADGEDDSSQQ